MFTGGLHQQVEAFCRWRGSWRCPHYTPIMPQWVENKGMSCLSNPSAQSSKKPGPEPCSYITPNWVPPEESPSLVKIHRSHRSHSSASWSPSSLPFCSKHPLSWSCKHAHASQGHTHTHILTSILQKTKTKTTGNLCFVKDNANSFKVVIFFQKKLDIGMVKFVRCKICSMI